MEFRICLKDTLSHSDNVSRKIVDEGDPAWSKGFRHEELIKIVARKDGHLSAGVVEISNDGGLVFEFDNGEVDEA